MKTYATLLFTTLTLLIPLFADDLLVPPKLNEALTPEYPKELQAKGITGTVALELLVNESGSVEEITIQKALHPILDSLSMETASKLRFLPGTYDGEAVAVTLPYTFSFTLEKALNALSDQVRLQGKLLEKGSGHPLSGVTVYYIPSDEAISSMHLPKEQVLQRLGQFEDQEYEEGGLTTSSNSSGSFTFRGLPNGTFTLKTASLSHEQIASNLTIVADSLSELSYFLTPNDLRGYEVVVTYRSNPDEVSQRSLAAHELGSVAGASGDPLKAIHSLPGVARSTEDIVIRGARPEDNRFFIDDLEISRLFHEGDVRSVFNGYLLDEIKFYPSAYGVRYGNVIGGVIKAETKKSFDPGFSGIADVNILDMGFAVHGTISDKLSLTGSARLSERFGVVKWYVGKFFESGTLIPYYSDYFARATYKPNEKHIITLSTLGAADSLVVSGKQWEHETEKFNQSAIQWDWKISDKLILTTRYGHLYNNYWYNLSNYEEKRKTHANYVQEELQFKLNQKVAFVAGLHGNINHLDRSRTEYDPPESNKLVAKHTKGWGYGTLSPWLEATITPNEKLELVTGLRYDYYNELYYNGSLFPSFLDSNRVKTDISGDPSLRISARYKLNDKHTLKGGLGNYNQTPEPLGIAIDTLWGDSTLPSTKALHATVGHEWQINDFLSLDAQAYYNERWAIPRFEWNDGAQWFPDGKGRAYGLELLLKKELEDHFSGWVSYTLSQSEEKIQENYFSGSDSYRVTDNNQRHNLQLIGTWKLPKRWEIGSKFTLTSGNPATPLLSVRDTVYTWEEENEDGQMESGEYTRYLPTWGEKNTDQLKPAIKLNLRVAKKFLTKRTTMEVYADVDNILYPLYKTPEYKEYSYMTGTYEEWYMPPIPMVGVNVRF